MIRPLAALPLISSLWLVASCGEAQARPLYGGTLRLAVLDAFQSLAPEAAESAGARRLKAEVLLNLFEGLTTIGPDGLVEPQLATFWQREADPKRWRFQLRSGVKLHNGLDLTAQLASASLQRSFPKWRVTSNGDQVLIRTEEPMASVPARLSSVDAAIVVMESPTSVTGSGPFALREFVPGKSITFTAFEDHWQGRPYLDRIEIRMGVSARMMLTQLQAGLVDAAELSPSDARSRETRNLTLIASAALELLAIVKPPSAGIWVDRRAIQRGLLPPQSEASGSLLPQWLSGYSFLFPVESAKPARQSPTTMALGYENETISALVAQRIAFDARESGLVLTPSAGQERAPVRLVRVLIGGGTCSESLAALSEQLGAPREPSGTTSQACFDREKALLDSGTVLPLAHLPTLFAATKRVHDWRPGLKTAALPLADVWLEQVTR